MENSFREIRVFISSRCVGDYIPVRQKLFRLLKSSTVFEPSMFEGLGAATGYPKEVYTRELIDCDVCVFIIRNDDGLSEGGARRNRLRNCKEKEVPLLFLWLQKFAIGARK